MIQNALVASAGVVKLFSYFFRDGRAELRCTLASKGPFTTLVPSTDKRQKLKITRCHPENEEYHKKILFL